MISDLKKLANALKFEELQSKKDVTNLTSYTGLLKIFPRIKPILNASLKESPEEFQRTLKHIFRTLKLYFLSVYEDSDSSELKRYNLSKRSISHITSLLKRVDEINRLLFPLVLILHDLGRFVEKQNHPYESYVLIDKQNLLEGFELTEEHKLLIKKVIQYHLLLATIFTGESTFYATFTLLKDKEFVDLISKGNFLSDFLIFEEAFTYIDILGYSYSQIYDHYIYYYQTIRSHLQAILSSWKKPNKALRQAIQISKDWLMWRISGALRIFQFVKTNNYLTEDFYYSKLKEVFEHSSLSLFKRLSWDTLKREYLDFTSYIQVKYGLGFLMLLALGKFRREPLRKNQKISDKLLYFWTLLSKKIQNTTTERRNNLWNVYFHGLPHWSQIDAKKFSKTLTYQKIRDLLENSKENYNASTNEVSLVISFNSE